jgi:hypothetical protein
MNKVWSRESARDAKIFFVVGAPRCGTTALGSALRAHPQICFSMPKEPHYFTRLRPGWTLGRILVDYLPLYFKHWPGGDVMLADGSTSYLYSDQALDAITRCFPQARFIVMARNPLEMVPSFHKKMLFLLDENEPDLARAWALQESRSWGEDLPKRCRDWRLLQYRDVGRVGARCEALLQRVERERVRFILFDDFAADPLAAYRDTLEFLGLPDDGRTVVKRRNSGQLPKSVMLQLMIREPRSEVARALLTKLRRSRRFKLVGRTMSRIRQSNREAVVGDELSPELRAVMAEAFAEDVRILSRIFGRDLSYWLSGDRAAGTAPPRRNAALEDALVS